MQGSNFKWVPVPNFKWVPVTEAVPDEPCLDVLVTLVINNDVHVHVGSRQVGGEWYVPVFCGHDYRVTHWMPLPMPGLTI